MILTVCLNPSTDVTIEVDAVNVGKLNHVKSKSLSFAGKALNVAIGVSRLKGESYATGFMYNENGSMFEQALDREGVPSTFVWNRGRVRENYKFIDNKSMLTEVNDVGDPVSANKQEENSHTEEACADKQATELLELVASLSKKSDVMVVSGSLPQGVAGEYYTKLFEAAAPGILKIADAEGPRLYAALRAGVDLIKPNQDELQNTLKKEMKSKEELLRGCYSLLDQGAKRVLLSLGKKGAILTDGTKSFYCKSINVAINSTVGAGDAMLAAATMRLQSGAPLEEILRAGVAAGTARVTTFGQISFTKNKFDEIYTNLNVEEIRN